MEWIVSLTPEVGLDALASPPAGATTVEFRADLFPGVEPAAAVARCPLPLLYTLRSAVEGGRGPEDPVQRRYHLERARDAGVHLIDLEADRDLDLVRDLGLNPAQVIFSWHDPAGTPPDLEKRAAELLSAPAGLVKVVTFARTLADLERLLRLAREHNHSRHRRRLVTFGMGPAGLPSRYLSPLLGPRVAYAAWDPGAEAAPGQVPLARLRAAMEHLSGPPARLFAVAGGDVSGSLSPVLHAGGYTAAGIHGLMVPVNVAREEELERLFVTEGNDLFARAAGLPLRGLAVTAPWKEHAVNAATMASPRARRARAANTLIPGPGSLRADTTDADGVRVAVSAVLGDPAGLTAVVQGTGGAARSVAVGLDLAGCRVFLRGRQGGRTRSVARELRVEWLEPGAPAPGGSILVNATPVGLDPLEGSPFAEEEVARASLVVDLVYGDRGPTVLEAMCAAMEVRFVGGAGFLLLQGIPQFAAMTGTVPPRRSMAAALERFVPLSGLPRRGARRP